MVTSGSSVAMASAWPAEGIVALPVEGAGAGIGRDVPSTATVRVQLLLQRSAVVSTLEPLEAPKWKVLAQGTGPAGLSMRKKVAPSLCPAIASGWPLRLAVTMLTPASPVRTLNRRLSAAAEPAAATASTAKTRILQSRITGRIQHISRTGGITDEPRLNGS